jgi:hypothetical protein
MLPAMWPRATLGVLLLGALVLRLIAIGDPLSHDEGYTWLVASAHSPGVFLDRLAAFENTPPLYYLLTSPLPDDSETWLRTVSVLAGVGCVAAVWWVVGFTLSTYVVPNVNLAAGFAAGALAVAPFAVSYSDYARGFVLADAALIVALGAALQRRWWLYSAAAAVALYTEYDSALFLMALSFVAGWRALPPLALLLPWLPEALRHSTTKVSPVYPNPSPGSLRDTIVRLTFGEHGTAHAASLRWLQFALVAAVCVWAFKKAPRALGIVAGGTLVLHALAHWIGPDVFAPRYLTELIPLGAIALGCAVASLQARTLQVAAAAALAALGVAVAVKRSQGNGEPDMRAITALITPAARHRIVLTNSAAFAFYLQQLHPHLDRPFGLGRGLEQTCAAPCRRSFLIVDDTRVANGPRPGPGAVHVFGPVYVRASRP